MVIGGSIAGLLAAQVLSVTFDRVVILDRYAVNGPGGDRPSVPQAKHPHTLLRRGEQIFNDLFPGVTEDLVRHGAVVMPMERVWWWQHRGYRAALPDAAPVISCSRPLLERLVRDRVARDSTVVFCEGKAVGLASTADVVTGVLVRDGSGASTIRSDLVVDCSGRRSSVDQWLTQLGFPSPDLERVESDVRYTSRVFHRSTATRADGAAGYFVISDPKARKRFGAAMPIEDDRWIINLAGMHGETAPTEVAEYLDWARTLPTAKIADIIQDEAPIGAAFRYRLPGSEWRMFHRLARHPRGLVCLGDSVCSLNALYGQGMTSAAIQAQALKRTLFRRDSAAPGFVRAFYRHSARAILPAWTMATGADFVYPETRGRRPWSTQLVNKYVTRCTVAGQHDRSIASDLWDIANLVKHPAALMRPQSMARALYYSRRGPCAGVDPLRVSG